MADSHPIKPWRGTGWPIKIFKDPVKAKKFLCTRSECYKAGGVLRDPVQLECGDRVCRECFEIILRLPPQERKCDACLSESENGVSDSSPKVEAGDDCATSMNTPSLPPDPRFTGAQFEHSTRGGDGAFAKEIDQFLVACPNGCGVTHVNQRPLTIGALKKHLAECVKKPPTCRLCMKSFYGSHHSHLITECFATKCPFGCTDIKPGELTIHHLDDESKLARHVGSLYDMLMSVKETQDKNQGGAVQSGITPSQMTTVLDRVVQLEWRSERAERQLAHQMTPQAVAQFNSCAESALIIYLSVQGWQPLFDQLKLDLHGLSLHDIKCGALASRANHSMDLISETSDWLEDMACHRELQLKERRNSLENMMKTSYDGRLIWRIDQVLSKRSEADIRLGFTSQPFYTKVQGYKMCTRIYLNGNGTGLGCYMSLFLIVMKGEYDRTLNWPLTGKVTMKCRSQVEGKPDVVKIFRVDGASFCFAMPVGEMNIASGCPQLVTQERLFADDAGFVVDDTMFIEVTVDTEYQGSSDLEISVPEVTESI